MPDKPNTDRISLNDCPCIDFSTDGHCLDCGKKQSPSHINEIDYAKELVRRGVLLPRNKVHFACKKCGGTEFLTSTNKCVDCHEKAPLTREEIDKRKFFMDYYGPPAHAIEYLCEHCSNAQGYFNRPCPNCGKRIIARNIGETSDELEMSENVGIWLQEIYDKYNR